MKPARGILGLVLLVGCTTQSDPPPPEESGEELSGGALTVFDETRDAYSRPAPNLRSDFDIQNRFFVGNSFFNQNWVTAPSTTEGRDGLGPTFNATSCSACHFKDGRGAPPTLETEEFLGLLLRISVPGVDAHGGPRGVPGYGGQLNHRSILGVPAEVRTRVTQQLQGGAYDDGTPYELAAPVYALSEPAFGAFPPDMMVSPRVAPAVFGLGLLEALPESVIVAGADPDDADGDGISGRVNRVWDPELGAETLGRFGWKANQPSLLAQNTGAFLGDMGITSTLQPDENCPAGQDACAVALHGGMPEIDDSKIEAVTFYTRILAVPGRRHWEEQRVVDGKAHFSELGCARCHTPQWTTSATADVPELQNQHIRPYTDLLLHDLGDGLADGRPDFLATGSEWRTPPLWGIGLVQTVNRHTRFLHDGRARSLAEAILWHGGEAAASRDRFRALSSAQRGELLAFLESL